MVSINPLRRVEPIHKIGPLFDYQGKGKTPEKQVPRRDSSHVSLIGRLFSDLENVVGPMNITLKLRQASMDSGVCEVDLRKYVKNKNFLSGIEERGSYESVSDSDKIALLSMLVSYGAECPAVASLSWKQRNGKTLAEFDIEDVRRTFSNEYRASRVRIREFERRYSHLFSS